jgi:hypothetical protein
VNQAIFVLSWNEELIRRLAGKTVVVFAPTIDELTRAIQTAGECRVNIHRAA